MVDEQELRNLLVEQEQPAVTGHPTSDTGEKFVCEQCGKEFSNRMGWVSHQRTHKADTQKKSSPGKAAVEPLTLPPDYQLLSDALKRWGIPKAEAIASGMTLTHLDDYTKMRELMLGFSTPANMRESFIQYWQGVRAAINHTSIPQNIEPKQSPLKDILSTMQDTLQLKMLKSMMGEDNQKSNQEVENLKTIVSQLQNQIQNEKTRHELELLKEQNRQQVEDYKNQVGSVAGTMKEFMEYMGKEFDLLKQQMVYEKKLDAMEQKVKEASMSGRDLMMKKGIETVEKVGDGLGKFAEGVGKATVKASDSTNIMDKINSIFTLKNAGFTNDQIALMIGGNNARVPSAAATALELQQNYDKLDSITKQASQSPEITQQGFNYGGHVSGTEQEKPVKFSSGSNES